MAKKSPAVECAVQQGADLKLPAVARRPSSLVDTRVIYCGDNLEQLKKLPDACVDLIYIDPPFNSNRNYEVFWGETKEKRAFEDRHASTQAYIEFMRPRCVQLARVLKKTGSFYYHCDWHASHYVKVMLDHIFGENNFQNEIVWRRHFSHNDPKKFGCVHDVIFYYVAGKTFSWNQQHVAHSESYIKSHYSNIDEDGRAFQLVSCSAPGDGPPRRFGDKELKPPAGRHWSWTQEGVDELITKGRIVFTKTGMPRLKQYLDAMKGVPLQDVWDDIPPVNSQAVEALGYPTQKPLVLLDRIIKASSNENDIVLDAFCGCGTALVAAQNLRRQWIGIDVSPTACRVMAKRLRDVCGLPESEPLWKIGRGYVVRGLPWSEEKLRAIPPFEFENWAVIALGGIPNKVQVGDMGVDGRIYPVSSSATPRRQQHHELALKERWYPIQVKQKDKAGRPDIDSFEAVMMREQCDIGFFVSFDFTEDAYTEIGAFFKRTGKTIRALTVSDILDETKLGMKLA
jgi:adenine-specific DNA-methyltransferase